ncbi:MAG: DUF6020 family protein [Spirochaetaceae bacterium]|nr:DUF6020 family protein [Spirochaetaceae bacterium]
MNFLKPLFFKQTANRIREDFSSLRGLLMAGAARLGLLRTSFNNTAAGPRGALRVYLALTALYCTLTVYFMNSPVFADPVRTAKSIISSFFLFVIFYLLLQLWCIKTKELCFRVQEEKQSLKPETFFCVFIFCFTSFFILFLINFPGGITTDNESQWRQIQSFSFNDWHPAIHTFLMWLLTRIINHYGFIIFCQITIFSISLGILTAVMEAWGFPRIVQVCMTLFFALNPMVKNILMFAYKDTVFTIVMVFTVTSLINIYFSGGKWLESFRNTLKISLCIALLSLVRHNGILFTIPLGFLLLLFYAKKNPRTFLIVPASLLFVLLVRLPLYSALQVEYPNNTYTETVGVPMTIMCDVFIKNPDALPQDARKFLSDFDKESGWTEKYELGNFSSAKSKFDGSRIIAAIPKAQFVSMITGTILADPYNSFQAFRNHSAFVWELFTPENSFISAPWKRDLERETNPVKKTAMYLSVFFDNAVTAILPAGWLLARNGWHVLILIMAGLFGLYRTGVKSLILVLPVIFYTFSTMMLLSASDLRYFQFNAVIVLPLSLALLSKKTNLA